MKLNLDFRYNFKFILTVYIISSIVGGYALAIVGGISDNIGCHFQLTNHQLSILLGLVFLGGILAKLVWLAADYLGRRVMIIAFIAMYLFGTYLFVESQDYQALIIGRFIQGAAILLCTYAFPVYITELAPAEKRGTYVTMFQLFWTLGMCMSGLAIYFLHGIFSWSQYMYITMPFTIVLLVLICLLPASPTWLILRRRVHDAYKVIQKTQPNLSDNQIKAYIYDMRTSLRDHEPKTIWQKMLIGKDIWPVLLVTAILILNQLTGINFIVFSSKLIILPMANEYVANITNFLIVGVNFIATIITVLYIDKWGRKRVIFSGLIVALTSMLLLSLLFSLPSFAYSYIVTISLLVICVAGLAFGPSGVVVTLINELLPNRVRIIGIFMAGTVAMIFSFFFIGYFLRIGDSYGFNVMFGILFVSSFIYLLVVKKLVPETAGRTLEEIEGEFE